MAFTVFDSFAEVYDDFDASDPEDLRDRAMLADAIMMYGLHGVEAAKAAARARNQFPTNPKRRFPKVKT